MEMIVARFVGTGSFLIRLISFRFQSTHNIRSIISIMLLMQHVSTRRSHHQATLKPYGGVQSTCAHLGSQSAYNNMYV